MTATTIVYCIDGHNKLVDIREGWDDFARANNARSLSRDAVLNKPLFDLMSDPQCVHLYKLLIERVRHRGHAISFNFRCDSPDKRRFMRMEMIPEAHNNHVCFKSTVQKEESRLPVILLNVDVRRSTDTALVCSWCKQVKVAEGQWLEIEAAIDELGLFHAQPVPRISHGMCPACLKSVWSTLLK